MVVSGIADGDPGGLSVSRRAPVSLSMRATEPVEPPHREDLFLLSASKAGRTVHARTAASLLGQFDIGRITRPPLVQGTLGASRVTGAARHKAEVSVAWKGFSSSRKRPSVDRTR